MNDPGTTDNDRQHLQLLSIFYYVFAGLLGLFSLLFLVYILFGVVVLAVPELAKDEAAKTVAWIFILIGVLFSIIGCTAVGLLITTGRYLTKNKHYTFCLVVAGFACLFMPLGTILGVFTFVVMLRPSVKTLFEEQMRTLQHSGQHFG